MTTETEDDGPPSPPPALVEARRLYEGSGLNISEIARHVGMKRPTLQGRIDREGWRRDNPLARRDLVASVRARVECEIAAAQTALTASGGVRIVQLERAARVLASLFRTLREMERYDRERAEAAREGTDHELAVDSDELYRELSRRIAELKQRTA